MMDQITFHGQIKSSFIRHHHRQPFLSQIITDDEKWYIYVNVNPSGGAKKELSSMNCFQGK